MTGPRTPAGAPARPSHINIVLRPPNGSKFVMMAGARPHAPADMTLRIERKAGELRKAIDWLHGWIDAHIAPQVIELEAEEDRFKVATKEDDKRSVAELEAHAHALAEEQRKTAEALEAAKNRPPDPSTHTP